MTQPQSVKRAIFRTLADCRRVSERHFARFQCFSWRIQVTSLRSRFFDIQIVLEEIDLNVRRPVRWPVTGHQGGR
jgi:hypothetical protein